MPVRSATTAASPICSVLVHALRRDTRPVRFVKNGLAVHADQLDGVERDASRGGRFRESPIAYSSPSRKFKRAMAAVCVIEFETASSASRTSFGYGVERNATG